MASGSDGDVEESARQGADPHRRLEGEPASPSSSQEADLWIGIYRQLLSLEERLETAIMESMEEFGEPARREAEMTNLPLIRSQMNRFRRRLTLWERHRRELDGRYESGGSSPRR